jgi:hypothetical protein
VGRKKVDLDLERMAQIPLKRRTNIRSLAAALDVAPATLHRRFKDGMINLRHSNALKPALTEENKRQRLQFCLGNLECTLFQPHPQSSAMFNTVRIDEKWFFMSRTADKLYLLPTEDEP